MNKNTRGTPKSVFVKCINCGKMLLVNTHDLTRRENYQARIVCADCVRRNNEAK